MFLAVHKVVDGWGTRRKALNFKFYLQSVFRPKLDNELNETFGQVSLVYKSKHGDIFIFTKKLQFNYDEILNSDVKAAQQA